MNLHYSSKKTTRRNRISDFFAVTEHLKTSDKFILRILLLTTVVSLVLAFIFWSKNYSVTTPVSGGSFIEGLVGTPRFLNPALAVTRADLDATALLYSGMMRIDTDGNLVPDLAESVTTSDDGKTFNIIMRKNLRFHDMTPLTSADVAFTIGLIQNPDLKSPLRGSWSDVTVEVISEYELNIIISEPYAPFIENFTLGIMPKHIWSNIQISQLPFSEYNTEPIGSGVFKISKIKQGKQSLIESYTLSSFTENSPVKLDGLQLNFYSNEKQLRSALESGEITATSQLSNEDAKALSKNPNFKIAEYPLPRVFAIFFNQNKSPALRDPAVRLALSTAINRDELVESGLFGFGFPLTHPIPTNHPALKLQQASSVSTSSAANETAENILQKSGWAKNNTGNWEKRIDGENRNLAITLKTANSDSFTTATEVIARAWRDLGVDVKIEQFEQSDLLIDSIRPRDFESLLFGFDMNRSVDMYPFWHSSQREDPGLNVSQYANIEVDKLLSISRTASSTDVRNTATYDASTIIVREVPAAFLYSPNLVYISTQDLQMSAVDRISRPQERFMNVAEWHIKTQELWPIFK